MIVNIMQVENFVISNVLCSLRLISELPYSPPPPARPSSTHCPVPGSQLLSKCFVSCSIDGIFINLSNLEVVVTFLAAKHILIIKL